MLFNERELSKKDFERIDIDVRSMPKEIKEKLLNGEATPLVEIRDQLDNGIIATMPVKLRLQRSEDGKAVLKAYPVSKDIVSDLKLTDKEQKQLQAGEVITKDVREGNKTRTMYLQADQETKSLLKRDVKQAEIDKRMDELEHVRNITLGQNQRQAIREGKPVELEVGDTKVTVGVDLRQNSGFKAIDGDPASRPSTVTWASGSVSRKSSGIWPILVQWATGRPTKTVGSTSRFRRSTSSPRLRRKRKKKSLRLSRKRSSRPSTSECSKKHR